MKVKIVKKENDESVMALNFKPENDDEIRLLKELWSLNHIFLHQASYERIGKKITTISFWMDDKNEET
ncbi:hypothetical protein LCGC14_1742160 [marine sediment metagenome]|uniref:Uncharacterized protein n=1 Tax=marine sediment metagenome TaxID=412755 RepID=A0A0F9K611_9ZZZZ